MNKYFMSGIIASFLGVSLVFNGLYAKENNDNSKSVETKQQRIDAYNKLTKVINTIEAYYVDNVSINEIVDKAIEGLLSNLDAHSAYLTEKKFKDLKAQTDGEFGGLGITVGMKDGALTVIAPLDDTPASKAGLKAGDVILKINDESTLNMTIDDAVNIMRGKPKTSLKLTIVRKTETKPLEFTIVRDIIRVKSVHARKIDGTKYLYVRVNSFDKNVTESVVNELKKAGEIKGIVLDLRNNPGGLLNQAVDLSNLFIKKGLIVSQKGKIKEENLEYKANGKAPYPSLPIVVLVNGGTASASEIVSGALQDHDRALIIGEETFGKGSVQVVLPIDKNEAIKLTTAKYYLPSGRTIQAVGIKPDIVVHPGAVPQNESSFEIKEADLRNHLESELEKVGKKTENKKNDNKKNEVKKTEEQKTITQTDINSDIQLKSAIDALKAWNIIKTPSKNEAGK
ncbi:peptidase S41 [Helicobacter sp. 12S02232-10]|uniref:S41 family peptidase n=1 Tax=Helicobacter sp. 12S02232-10 TaxID=1476197 RepID=UPI000BA71405|nr:S41 family peptidase [Helicobacter sp. 12S02232-10]PAF49955.1 peptidase S41 [Helicobacter sp. 12S02232-10]